MTVGPEEWPPEGHRIGPYQIVSRFGAGGMGEVDRAHDTRFDRTVAIKVLPAHAATDPHAREPFEREARAVAALNHPHICTLHDVGHQDGIDFLVMEHLDGETLAARLDRPLVNTVFEPHRAVARDGRAELVGGLETVSLGPNRGRTRGGKGVVRSAMAARSQ